MNLVETYRSKIENRLQKKTTTFLVVVGPCSIACEIEALNFAHKLSLLQKDLGDDILLVMRAFVEKSRTSHSWRGFVYGPDLEGPENILMGLKRTKNLFSQLNVPLAMEFIDPSIYLHLQDYITWGFIGARTATSSPHRIMASDSGCIFGFKHSLDGDVSSAINSVHVARHSHCILTNEGQKYSKGNPRTHVVLRGGKSPNYDSKNVQQAHKLSKKQDIDTPLLIDCSHGNCINKPDDQKTVFLDVLDQYLQNPDDILGVMLESNIFKGSQKESKKYGVSLTDPCLDFEETKALILYAKKRIIQKGYKEESNQPTFYV